MSIPTAGTLARTLAHGYSRGFANRHAISKAATPQRPWSTIRYPLATKLLIRSAVVVGRRARSRSRVTASSGTSGGLTAAIDDASFEFTA